MVEEAVDFLENDSLDLKSTPRAPSREREREREKDIYIYTYTVYIYIYIDINMTHLLGAPK